MLEDSLVTIGGQSFRDFIRKDIIYVDKTSYLADLIDNSRKRFFLARPGRFGKSLTVSTLEAIFSGEKELFKGLAVESRLREKKFAPRPVIRLDMSATNATDGIEKFVKSLNIVTAEAAERLDAAPPLDNPPAEILSSLISETYKKFNSKPVVLIDEYDSPVSYLLDKHQEAEKVRKILREYYEILKINEKLISFCFVTGLTKFAHGGLFSSFKRFTDISLDHDFGAITGFTRRELENRYKKELDDTADRLDIPRKKLFEKMNQHYNGFCFDGRTVVYNPFSILLFLRKNEFLNYWYDAGVPYHLISFSKRSDFTIHELINVKIEKERLQKPACEYQVDPAAYLYQIGFLRIRKSTSENISVLDYPNLKVKTALARDILRRHFDSASKVERAYKSVEKALRGKDPELLMDVIDSMLSTNYRFIYNSQYPDGRSYSELIFNLFYALEMKPQSEKSYHSGNYEFVVKSGTRTWFTRVIMNRRNYDDKQLAERALVRIKKKISTEVYKNPIILVIVFNNKNFTSSWWRCDGGIAAYPYEEKNYYNFV
ncbi:MAG: AAA family ATPase [Deltaproteobacteria bacterium]|jgi:hypothetical protein|nr:AAA family ATPase [Deltaproteobacteria bacterium]